ncbi:hypothetical protein BGY98DRAFT_943838 [Russula aff. rugulosa BPL654]|nr:hypothetical protein BGY98DRAFT_943838 [Russula aff. rugulosa BPL654]
MSPMSVALPRPILKHSPQSHPVLSNDAGPFPLHITTRQCRNTVHFPPSPTLTRTFSAHSPSTYDRSPIVVSPNICALPARGCPGRTYIPGCGTPNPSDPSDSHSRMNSGGKHMHPRRALSFGIVQEATPDDLTPTSEDIPPPLIPDVSSESDESDGFTSPVSGIEANATVPNPLTFLPFASLPNLNVGESAFQSPLSPEEEEGYQYHRYEEGKRRRRKPKRTNGISGEELEEDDEAEDGDIAQCQYKSFCSVTSFGGYGFKLEADDETCLGGF